MSNKTKLFLEGSVQGYFFDELLTLNKRCSMKLPNEQIHYASLVMDHYSLSRNYFEEREGKIKEKWLGLKLLESSERKSSEQKRILKDIGDSVLFLCGYFSPYLSRKIVNADYYIEIGRTAYERLDKISPAVYEVRSFYHQVAKSIVPLSNLLSILAENQKSGLVSSFILDPKKAS